jgi:ribosome-binding protein aMBF1 (putative translation factor)
MATNQKSVNGLIRKHRLLKGLSQTDLGQKLSISAQQVNSWEKGRSVVPVKYACKICKLLGIRQKAFLAAYVKDYRNQISKAFLK